ncbi:MAG: hypothetical protein ACM3N4_10585 [Nitrososphaerota archaeon]
MDTLNATSHPPTALAASISPSSPPLPPAPAPGWQRLWRALTGHWLLVLFVGSAGAVANFWALGEPGLWYDEVISADLAHLPVGLLWRYIWGSKPNMELYYLLLHDWMGVLGVLGIQPTEFVLRIPSALCGALGAVVLYQLGNRFFGGRFVGLFAALLYILNQGQIAAAQQLRSYSMEILFCCLMEYVFLEALLISRRPNSSWRTRMLWWGAYVLVAGLIPYVHLFSALLLLSQGIMFLLLVILPGPWRAAARASFFWAAGSFVLVVMAAIPAIWIASRGGYNDWVGTATLNSVANWFVSLSNNEGAYLAISAVLVVLGVLTSIALWMRAALGKGAFPQPGMLVLACWFLITAGVAYAVTQPVHNLHLFYVRYLIVMGPAWWLAIAASVHQLRRVSSLVAVTTALVVVMLALRSLQVPTLALAAVVVAGAVLLILYERYQQLALALVLLVLAFYGTPGYYSTAAQQDFRNPYLWLQQQYQPGDGIFCHPDYDCSIALDYYLWAYPGKGHFDADSPGVYNWYTGGFAYHATAQGAQAYAAEHNRIFFVTAPVVNGVSDASRDAIMAWLGQHYILAGQYSSTVGADYPRTVLVQLYVKQPAGP